MKNTIIPAAHLFLMRGNTVLLAKRLNTGYHDGDWSVIAGHVEKGEFPEEAMIREAMEEAGIEIKPEDLACSHVMSRIGQDERVDFFFTCKHWNNEVTIMETHKCDAMEWFPMDSLPENTIPYIRQALEEVHSGKSYSERQE